MGRGWGEWGISVSFAIFSTSSMIISIVVHERGGPGPCLRTHGQRFDFGVGEGHFTVNTVGAHSSRSSIEI